MCKNTGYVTVELT